MRRSSLFPLAILAVVLTACGTSSQASTAVTASLGAKSLPLIKPPAYLPGPFDGQSTPRNVALRRPLAVIIENYAPDSRPQTGLAEASTVFETLAEGGVTRFMAVFLEHDAAKVGPVRSTRMYFDNLAGGLHAILTHVGGNDDAQAYLWHLPKVFNIDEMKWEVNLFNTGTPLFWRSADRVAPHNMYVSTYKLRSYADHNRQDWAYEGAYLLHKWPAPLKRRGHGTTVDIAFTNPLGGEADPDYHVTYRYSRLTNSYLRIMGGSPHVDAATRRALQPANVIVMKTDPAVADPNAGPTPQSILIRDTGTGPAIYFRDGTVVYGRWQQRDQFAPLRFYDRRGRQVAFNPGQTWIELVPQGSPITWRAW